MKAGCRQTKKSSPALCLLVLVMKFMCPCDTLACSLMLYLKQTIHIFIYNINTGIFVSSFPLYCMYPATRQHVQATQWSKKLNFASRLIILTYTYIPTHHRNRLIACPTHVSLRPWLVILRQRQFKKKTSTYCVCYKYFNLFPVPSSRQMIQIQGLGVKSNTRFMDQDRICK